MKLVVSAFLLLALSVPAAGKRRQLYDSSVPMPDTNGNNNTVIAQVSENICLLSHDIGNTDAQCADRNLQSEVGGGAPQVISQAYFSVLPTIDFAFQDIAEAQSMFTKGPFTYNDVVQVLPYPSDVLEIYQMNGSQIVAVINEGFDAYFPPSSNTDSYPVAAGLRWYVNGSLPSGQRVFKVEVNPRLSGSWSEIDMGATYLVGTNTYSSTDGNFGYTEFGNVKQNDPNGYTKTDFSIQQALVKYAQQQGIITDVPPSTYSTQYLVFQDGTVVDLSSLEQNSTATSNSNFMSTILWSPMVVGATFLSLVM
jgi:5'-nucleotidase/UDP-sugar diphosphatase